MDIKRPSKKHRSIKGNVIYIDSFGNLITNIKDTDIKNHKHIEVRIKGYGINGLSSSYIDVKNTAPAALIGSGGYLEVACFGKSAAILLQIEEGEEVEVILK